RPRRSLGGTARNLRVIPIFAEIAFANHKVDVVGKVVGVLVIQTPLPVMIAVAEFLGRTIGNPYLPELPAKARRFPLQPADVHAASGKHDDIAPDGFAENTIRNRVQCVSAWANFRNGKT